MATFESEGVQLPDGPDVSIDITVSGDEDAAEIVHFEAREAAVRAMQAIKHRKHPDECSGVGVAINWDRKFEILDGEGER